MADPTTENPLAQAGQIASGSQSASEVAGKDVLTLHRGIFGRWSGGEAGSMLQRLDMLGAGRMVVAAEQMIAGLPGLASLGGSFGKQAWEMAGSIASSPQLLGRLGLQSRSLNVSELADLIQVVLEELEPADGSELAAAEGQYRSARKAAASNANVAKNAVAKHAAVTANRPNAARNTAKGSNSGGTKRVAPGQAAKLKAVRQLLAELQIARADAARHSDRTERPVQIGEQGGAGAPGSGDPAMAAKLGPLDTRGLDAPGSRDPMARDAGTSAAAIRGQNPLNSTTHGDGLVAARRMNVWRGLIDATGMTRATHDAGAAAPATGDFGFGGLSAGNSSRTSVSGTAWLHPLAATYDVAAAAPRSLRMAEQAAELAMLAPGAEPIVASDWSVSARSEGGARSDRADTGAGRRTGTLQNNAGAGRAAAVRGSQAPTAHSSAYAASGNLTSAIWAAQVARQNQAQSVNRKALAANAVATAPAAIDSANQVQAGKGRAKRTAANARSAVVGNAAEQTANIAGDTTQIFDALVTASQARAQANPQRATGANAGGARQSQPNYTQLNTYQIRELRANGAAADSPNGVPVAGAARGALSALAQAVAIAGQNLARMQRFEQMVVGNRPGSFSPTANQAGTTRAAASTGANEFGSGTTDLNRGRGPLALSNPELHRRQTAGVTDGRNGGIDGFAGLFARGGADHERTHTMLPRLADWLGQSEKQLTDGALLPKQTPDFLGAVATGATTVGYRGLDSGAGEWLVPGLVEAADTADGAPTPTSGRAATAGRVAAVATAQAIRAQARAAQIKSAVPAWLVPQTAANRAQAASAAQASGSASAAARTPAAAREFADLSMLAPQSSTIEVASSVGARNRRAGMTALSAAGMAARVSARHESSLDAPNANFVAPGRSRFAALAPASFSVRHRATTSDGVAQAAQQIGSPSFEAFARQVEGTLGIDGKKATAQASSIASDGGAGEWLVTGADGEFAEANAATANVSVQNRNSLSPRAPSGRAGVATGSATASGTPIAKFAEPKAWAAAAAAAIERVVEQSARSGKSVFAGRSVAATAASLLDFAGLQDAGLLAARPNGARDALTPWLEKRLAQLQAKDGSAGQRDGTAARSLNLPEAERTALQPGPDGATEGTHLGAIASPQAKAAVQAGGRSAKSPLFAVGAGDHREPAALRAALALFGDTAAPAQTRDAAKAYLARWFGKAPDAAAKAPSGAVSGKLGAHAGGGDVVQLRRDTTEFHAGSANDAGPDQMVFTGLAALAAMGKSTEELKQMSAAQRPSPREMRTADVERTALAPTAESGDNSIVSAPVARAVTRRTGAGMHQFSPISLRRGRGLLSSSRRAGGLLRTAPRQGLLARQTTQRAGYGASTLGGGDLVGLTGNNDGNFFGDSGPMPAGVRGADLLSSQVQARRSERTGRGHAAAVAQSGQTQQHQFVRTSTGNEGPSSLPSDFGGDFVRPQSQAAAVQQAIAASGRGAGATAGMKSIQAGAMARVLSVTDAPSANMLPLVAPAARAVVAAAAAKPLSESIVTSGADSSLFAPITSMGGGKKSKGGGEQAHAGAESGHGQPQDLDALAAKIARAVMVRIKRERERRGIHG